MSVSIQLQKALAHVDSRGRPHLLQDHLHAVAHGARNAASKFDAGDWAALAGLWHDLGKYRPGFQRYIRQANDTEAHIEGKVGGREKTHSAAGALWACQTLPNRFGSDGRIVGRVLSYLIAGHHAGLDNWYGGLAVRLEGQDAKTEFKDTLDAVPLDEILRPIVGLPDLACVPKDSKTGIPGSFALWVRMLFSSLVDADFLDTEAFLDGEKAGARPGFPSVKELAQRFDAHMNEKLEQIRARGEQGTAVNSLRADVLSQCRNKAALAPGVFTLTVPTGGGKTLSSLAFALRHAVIHEKRRVIYAIPYTSIIEQTADIYRSIFGDENVVEHHSNAESEPEAESQRSRLACENWDAPLVVTTNVQLFESLFARRTSRCRKLHRLVDSVIVLDEAQLLPVEFLQPIIDVLQLLVREYGVTLVLATATQPVLTRQANFDPSRRLRGFDPGQVVEIIDDVPALYAGLKRVEVHRPADLNLKREWPDVARDVAKHEAVLTIVNRRADARELYRLLRTDCPQGLWHLSALMCAQHRSDALAAIKAALEVRRQSAARGDAVAPVRVVSTQLVEAGVDLDFPVVFRAMAGLDSIAQAAGRCNREGKLEGMGHVHVFVPTSSSPPGLLRQAEQTCRLVWAMSPNDSDPVSVDLFQPYFTRLFADGDLDKARICEALKVGPDGDVRFRDAAEAFRLIDDGDAATVIVRYRSSNSPTDIDALIGLLERDGPVRWLMRKLQRYGVTIYRYDLDRLLKVGDIRPVGTYPGLYVQAIQSDMIYDPIVGMNVDGAPGDPGRLIQ